jgi:hypothetical protein
MTRYLILGGCLLAACSNGGGGGPGSPVGPEGTPVDGSSRDAPDGAAPADSAAAAPDLAPPIAGYGNVFVYLTHSTSGSFDFRSTSVGATFYDAIPATGTATCNAVTDAECVVTACSGTSSSGTATEAAAGDVTVAGAGQTVMLHTALDSHQTVSAQTLYWTGGETLDITSTGATVGAFNDSLVVPSQIQVSAPYLPAGTAVPISRASGLTLNWTGGGAGDAVFILSAVGASGSVSAVCRYPASQPPKVMPASVLSLFPAGMASFSASTQAQHEQRVGAWQVTSLAYFNAVYDTGASVAGQLLLN